MPPRHVTLALTGASGVQYGLRLLEVLLGSGIRCSLLISKPARVVIGMETDLELPGRPAEQRRWLAERFNADPELLQVYGQEQWTAPIASGSAVADAMVVCPCTTGTLCNIAGGASRNLIERAADVSIKERRPLILVLRETPLSSIHLEHMLRLSQAGATIMPASPGFYHRPERLQDLVDFLVARILDHLHVEHELMPPWGAESS